MDKKAWWKKIIWILLFLLAAAAICLLLIKTILGDLSAFLPYSKALLGFDEEKKYLILFQNNNEIRPSGGFISAYGILNIKKGKLSMDFADSYSLPSTTNLAKAPQPFNILLDDPKFKGWYFRDANFDVDFSDAAKDAEKLYWQQSGQKNGSFDGVFAINFEFLEDLVEIYDLKLENLELERENLFSILEYEIKNIDTHNVEDLKNRKNILAELTSELINKAIFSPSKYDDLFEAINIGLEQKKIILFFKDAKLQRIAENKGWAGRFDPKNYDNFIYTNIANIGGRKSDRYMKKNHEYFVSFDENGRAKIRYTLTLEHFGGYNLNSDIYKAYLRIFIPQEADFIKSEGDFYENRRGFTENGYFEGYVEIKPGEKKEIEIEYFLPEKITQNNFEIELIKQPGTRDLWELIVQLPANNSLRAADFEIRDNVGFWSEYLLQDRHFDFEYIKDNIPPVVVWQRFLEPNLIEINFSEPLNERIFLNSDNYEVMDMNYIDKKTDAISIEKVYFENNNVYLKTNGIFLAEGERYKLILKNLEDKSGNKTNPHILEATMVQSLKE